VFEQVLCFQYRRLLGDWACVPRPSDAGTLRDTFTVLELRATTDEFPLAEVNRLLGLFHRETLEHPDKKQCAIYARVSGHRQKTDGDLDRQLKTLITHCRQHSKIRPLVFTDIGSGLNMKRRGLRRLLSLAQRGVIETLFITHRDRLARFGTDLLQRIFQDYGVRLVIIMEEDDRTPQEELVTDMMALIASFSGRVYGLRAAALRTR